MTLINTATLGALDPIAQHQIYCGLDSMLTVEIRQEIGRQHNALPSIYNFERALQGPYLEMMQRGFRVDSTARWLEAERLERQIEQLRTQLNELACAIWDKGLNPRSHKQLLDFFYEALALPEQWQSQKGQRKLSTDREALEKLDAYLFARPFVSHILLMRDLAKQHEVFTTEIDADGRFRSSMNIAGTETGRPSSSENAFGTGGNLQNIRPDQRYVFIADEGHKLCVIDLEQVEARDVGWFCGCLFGDWKFLDNCESGDLHTNNAKLIWPGLAWTGDRVADRAIAEQQFYREFSHRDMSKRGGHLSNYMGTAWTAARALKVPQAVMDEFQARYVRGAPAPRLVNGKIQGLRNLRGEFIGPIEPAFPAIPRWWQWTAEQLQTEGHLTTPFGRKRHFFGRADDDATLREAIAFLPQSTTGDRTNLGLLRIWLWGEVQILTQTYDSVTFQYEDRGAQYESEVITKALALMQDIEFQHPSGRKYRVPGEAKVGWNWGGQVTAVDVARSAAKGKKLRLNLDGLVKWKPGADLRKRQPLGATWASAK